MDVDHVLKKKIPYEMTLTTTAEFIYELIYFAVSVHLIIAATIITFVTDVSSFWWNKLLYKMEQLS